MLTITRAVNVRRYETFQLDEDELTDEQREAVATLEEELILECPVAAEDWGAYGVLDDLLTEHDAVSEEYDSATEPDPAIINGEA